MNKLLLVITFGMDGPSAEVVSETDFKARLAEGEYGDDPDFRKLNAGDRLDFMSGEERVIVTEYWPYPAGVAAAEALSKAENDKADRQAMLGAALQDNPDFGALAAAIEPLFRAKLEGILSPDAQVTEALREALKEGLPPSFSIKSYPQVPDQGLTIEEIVGEPLVSTEEVSASLSVPMSELGSFTPVPKEALRSAFEIAEEFPQVTLQGHINACMNEISDALAKLAPDASTGIKHLEGRVLQVDIRHELVNLHLDVLVPPPMVVESIVNMKGVRKLELYKGTVRPQGFNEPEPESMAAETGSLEAPELAESINCFLFVSALVSGMEAPRQLHFFRTRDQALMALQRFYDDLQHTPDRPEGSPGLSLVRDALNRNGHWTWMSTSSVNPDRPPIVVYLQEVEHANVEFKNSGDRFGLEMQAGWDLR